MTEASAELMTARRPYKIFEEKSPCSHCGEGGAWTVELPDGGMISSSYAGEEGREQAEYICRLMNDAYELALDSKR